MRLFIAANLDQRLCEALAETSANLRSAIRGRYVSPDSFHVTLAFLGECRAEDVNRLEDLLDATAQDFCAISVQLAALGSFGREHAGVLWQGFEPSRELSKLAHELRSRLSEEGFSYDEKSFLPHVTLMRKAQLKGSVLPAACYEAGNIASISLMRSHLGEARAVYETLHRAYLRD
ncbi:MAG: RNA 2',3'-cyclic phosphodiesterase [Atopobiaceae bacterium]|nr:RNA 2',3'-cyclic phosphodiesterase [Atopobiaceae bacterium]